MKTNQGIKKIRHILPVTFKLFYALHGFKSQVNGNAISNLCKRNQTEQYHEILSCTVTKNLFNRFQIILTAIYPENVDEKEMVLGLKIDTKEVK